MSDISRELRKVADECLIGVANTRVSDLADRIDAEMVELPRGKDGSPIHVGDTVYDEDGGAWHVEGISIGRWSKLARKNLVQAKDDSGKWRDLLPKQLTHERPDSWERIADELEEWCNSVDVDGDACGEPRELARRIRRLASREEER